MVPPRKVVIPLTDEQRGTRRRLIHPGRHPAALRRRAHGLRKAEADGQDAWTDEEVAEYLETSRMTVMRVRQQFAAEGLDATRHRKKPAGRQFRKLDGKQEARRVALACTRPRTGTPGGPWDSWRTSSWNGTSLPRSIRPRSAGRSKKLGRQTRLDG